jgi:Nif-specific regulatory protein
MDYDWPGNVRELENTIERLVVMTAGKVITLRDIPLNIKDRSIKSKYAVKEALPSTIADIEKTNIMEALKKTGWVQAKAARLLGITPRQIGYKIRIYGIKEES